jgi:CRISPR-associated protein Csx10
MKKLNYTITTLEPLIITQHSDDPNMYETLQYIRGTVIQGIFAQNYLKANNDIADSLFTQLIVSGDCIFENAFPIANNNLYTPSPLSLVREKYYQYKAHNLLAGTTNELTKGISSLVLIDGSEIYPLTIRKEIRLHNEIDDEKRTTKDGILFNYQSLPAGLVFKGAITVKNDDYEAELIKIIPTETNLRIGRSATSEYGKVCFNWIEYVDEDLIPNTGEVIMTLLSDTIVYNVNGFSSLDCADINRYLKGISVTNSISRKSRIEGFLNVWKLRKPSENVFAAGSSFLLDRLPDNAEDLVNLGLGERTHEGYGQVSFSMLDSAIIGLNYNEWKETTLTEPDEKPKLTNDILNFVYLKRIKENVINKALNDAAHTNPVISSNHLIGRLKDVSHNLDDFRQFLTDLRSTARNHLSNSYLYNKNMIELFESILKEDTKLVVSNDGSDLNKQDSDNLKILYFEQYFNQLRRRNINNEKHGKR